jgi:hypothetical protein
MSITLDGTNGITQAGEFNSDSSFGFKNRIINGGMVIDQRNAGASVTITTAEEYIVDRFNFAPSVSSKLTGQQSTTAPAGFSNSILLTSSAATSVSSSDYYFMQHKIEGFNFADCGWGTANAKTVTLSFWARSSVTGTYGGALVNGAQNRSYPFTYTISSANTFEYKTITIVGDTTGTWIGATNGIGVRLRLGFGVGATYSGTAGAWAAAQYFSATGATNWISTSGATFYITGVQLEVGSTATSFDYLDYGRSLIQCQRYFVKLGGNDPNEVFGVGIIQASNNAEAIVNMPVKMRANPSASISGTAGNFGVTGPTGFTPSAISFDIYAPLTLRVSATISGATAGNGAYIRAGGSTAAGINISAEL